MNHGTCSCYAGGCRCDPCRAAHSTYNKAWYKADPDARRAYEKARHVTNPKRNSAQAKAWQEANPERRRAFEKKWRAANPDKTRLKEAQRRARKDAGMFLITERDWCRLCARWDNACAYCKTKAPLTQDHVIPLSRGGRHSIGNLLPSCRSCNASKGPRLLIEWRAQVRRAA